LEDSPFVHLFKSQSENTNAGTSFGAVFSIVSIQGLGWDKEGMTAVMKALPDLAKQMAATSSAQNPAKFLQKKISEFRTSFAKIKRNKKIQCVSEEERTAGWKRAQLAELSKPIFPLVGATGDAGGKKSPASSAFTPHHALASASSIPPILAGPPIPIVPARASSSPSQAGNNTLPIDLPITAPSSLDSQKQDKAQRKRDVRFATGKAELQRDKIALKVGVAALAVNTRSVKARERQNETFIEHCAEMRRSMALMSAEKARWDKTRLEMDERRQKMDELKQRLDARAQRVKAGAEQLAHQKAAWADTQEVCDGFLDVLAEPEDRLEAVSDRLQQQLVINSRLQQKLTDSRAKTKDARRASMRAKQLWKGYKLDLAGIRKKQGRWESTTRKVKAVKKSVTRKLARRNKRIKLFKNFLAAVRVDEGQREEHETIVKSLNARLKKAKTLVSLYQNGKYTDEAPRDKEGKVR